MKKIWFICILFTLAACKDDDAEELSVEESHCVSKEVVNSLNGIEGTIEHFEHFYLIKTSQRRYYAWNLPEEYKTAGKSILFDALEYKIPPHVKLMGIPIIITRVY